MKLLILGVNTMSSLKEVAKKLRDYFKKTDCMLGKCNSCTNKFNGRDGNGYQPCACNVKTELPPPKEV